MYLEQRRLLQLHLSDQSGRSPKEVALFSATNFSSYIIELLQLHDDHAESIII